MKIYFQIFTALISIISTSFPQLVAGQSELEQVKSALAEAALSGNVSVTSSAYINENGKLIESSFFKGSTSIKGIRVSNYFKNSSDREFDFQDTLFREDNECLATTDRKYKNDVVIFVSSEISEESDKNAISEIILDSLFQELENSRTNISNAAVKTIIFRKKGTSTNYDLSSYHRLSLPRDQSLNDSYQYKIEVLINGVNVVNQYSKKIIGGSYGQLVRGTNFLAAEFGLKNKLSGYTSPDQLIKFNVNIELEKKLTSNASPSKILSTYDLEVIYNPKTNHFEIKESPIKKISSYLEWPISSAKTNEFNEVLSQFINLALEEIACDLENYVATNNGFYTLDIGSDHGLMIGDRFVLSPEEFSGFSNRINSNILEKIKIGAVSVLENDRAEIAIIEGDETNESFLFALPF